MPALSATASNPPLSITAERNHAMRKLSHRDSAQVKSIYPERNVMRTHGAYGSPPGMGDMTGIVEQRRRR